MTHYSDGISILARRWGRGLLLVIAMATMLAPSSLHAGACMDGKLTAYYGYFFNDTSGGYVKNITVEYKTVINPDIHATVECAQVTDGTTDLNCGITGFNSYIYIIKGNSPVRIVNPGMAGQRIDVAEKICAGMSLAVYYLTGGKL